MDKAELESALHQAGVGVRDKILFCLSLEPQRPRELADIRLVAQEAGWPQAKKANLSAYLAQAKGLVAKMPTGWKLTDAGKLHVVKAAKLPSGPAPPASTSKLRAHLPKIQNADVATFVEESIKCLEYGLLRAAAVMSWVGAVGVLYDYVLKNKLAEFNAAGAAKHQGKWKPVATFDDLADIKESNFLELAESGSVIGKSVKKELQACLDFRNGCGHPNSLAIGEPRVSTHIDQLIRNVFEKF
jgi:hypothetical protein